ncbi:hypothetical protein KAI87_11805 [Myxococcota bacterium]|nr:hypothetical protein [Myxococcota bacterium]
MKTAAKTATLLSRILALSGALLLGLLSLSACGDEGPNYLEGSLADSYSIEFDSVRARLYESELSIEYVESSGGDEKISLRLAIRRNAAELAEGGSYDLVDISTVSRGSGYDSDIPTIESGAIRFDRYAESDGSKIEGEFDALFEMTDGSKKTLRGGFETTLEVVIF